MNGFRMTSVTAHTHPISPTTLRPVPAEPAPARESRPHLDELDRLRIVTAVAVVGVHVISSTAYSDHTAGLIAQDAFVTALHFTREMFMFVTSFALVYVYAGRPFSVGRFWKRRALGVLLPYAVWTLIYAWANPHPAAPLAFLSKLVWDLLTGNASYQLYYILLTIEFYLLFPWLLRWLRRVGNHPWPLLAASFALELAELYGTHVLVPGLALPSWAAGPVNLLVGRFVLTYQFYFVLGALAALHRERVRAFVLRHGRWLAAAGIAALAVLELHYVFALRVERVPLAVAVDVLQPIMVVYSLGIIGALYWWALWRVSRPAYRNAQRSQRVWRTLADAAFGIYLVHPLILTPLLADLVPRLVALPAIAQIGLTWLLTAASAIAVTLVLMRLPLLSRLVGREGPTVSAASEWLRSRVAGRGRVPYAPTRPLRPPVRTGESADLRGLGAAPGIERN